MKTTNGSRLDPKITVKRALKFCGGNQAELARSLGCGRAYVNGWVTSGRRYLPPLMAHRMKIVMTEQ